MTRWTHLDLFSGIGGFALAASWTREIDTIGFCEIDSFCRRVLAKHWPGVPQHDDIGSLSAELVREWLDPYADDVRQLQRQAPVSEGWGRAGNPRPDVSDAEGGGMGRGQSPGGVGQLERGDPTGTLDLITGGFPCQPFSQAGLRGGSDDHRYLWPELHRLVVSLRPRWCLFENVPGIINMADGLARVHTDLESAGYEVGSVVIPAAAVGARHQRQRLWIVAHAGRAEWRPGTGSLDDSHGMASRREEAASRAPQRGDVDDADDGRRGREAPTVRTGRDQSGRTSHGDVADADRAGREQHGRLEPIRAQEPAPQYRSLTADTARILRNRSRSAWGRRSQSANSDQHPPRRVFEALGRVGDAPDGVSGRVDGGSTHRSPWWSGGEPRYAFGPSWEAGCPRVTDHEEYRVAKLKSLGNAIVPQVAYELLLMMREADQ